MREKRFNNCSFDECDTPRLCFSQGNCKRPIPETALKRIADLERQLLDKSQIMGAQQAELDLHHAGQYCPSCNPCRRAPEITALEQQLAEAQKHAERYRWLRQAGWIDDAIMDANDIWDDKPETLDAAIDRSAPPGPAATSPK